MASCAAPIVSWRLTSERASFSSTMAACLSRHSLSDHRVRDVSEDIDLKNEPVALESTGTQIRFSCIPDDLGNNLLSLALELRSTRAVRAR